MGNISKQAETFHLSIARDKTVYLQLIFQSVAAMFHIACKMFSSQTISPRLVCGTFICY